MRFTRTIPKKSLSSSVCNSWLRNSLCLLLLSQKYATSWLIVMLSLSKVNDVAKSAIGIPANASPMTHCCSMCTKSTQKTRRAELRLTRRASVSLRSSRLYWSSKKKAGTWSHCLKQSVIFIPNRHLTCRKWENNLPLSFLFLYQ